MAESRIWHVEQKTQSCKEYYLLVQDGETTISCILTYDASKKLVTAQPYTPPDLNYTIHDSCDHENGECVLEDPDSSESEDVYMAGKHDYAVQNLLNLEKQVKRQQIAEDLAIAKKKQDTVVSEQETTEMLRSLLEKLPPNYPPFTLTVISDRYTLEIDRTIIYRDVSAQEAIDDTKDYVEVRERHPNFPIGVIRGIYD